MMRQLDLRGVGSVRPDQVQLETRTGLMPAEWRGWKWREPEKWLERAGDGDPQTTISS